MKEAPKKSFNLVKEPWISTNRGLVNLIDIFSTKNPVEFLEGNVMEKISIINLLLAISYASCVMQDEKEWEKLGVDGLSKAAISYLKKHEDCFDIYDPKKPFLQYANLKKFPFVTERPFNYFNPSVGCSDNQAILTQHQMDRIYTDAEKALILLINVCGFGFGGKKDKKKLTKKEVVPNGFQLGENGYLHFLIKGKNIPETIWLNFLTIEEFKQIKYLQITSKKDIGIPPFERMPDPNKDWGVNIFRLLIPLDRFMLIQENSIFLQRGFPPLNQKDVLGLSVSFRETKNDPSKQKKQKEKKEKKEQKYETINTDPEKDPIRELSAILGYVKEEKETYFNYLIYFFNKYKISTKYFNKNRKIGFWAVGLKISKKMGEYKPRQLDDYVDSTINVNSDWLKKAAWFPVFKKQIKDWENIETVLKNAFRTYNKILNNETSDINKMEISFNFWHFASKYFPFLIKYCYENNEQKLKELRSILIQAARNQYNIYCGHEMGEQYKAWCLAERKFCELYQNEENQGEDEKNDEKNNN